MLGGFTMVCAIILGLLQRLDFSDLQGGKAAGDRKVAAIKSHIRVHLNAGNDIETPVQTRVAILSCGGVPAVNFVFCEFILRAISKARRHQSDTECSVRGEWFTGLESVSTRPWKANSKAKLSIHPYPSFQPLLELLGLTRVASHQQRKDSLSKATERKDLPPATKAAELRSEGEESISKDRIFTCPEDGCVPTFLRYSSMRRLKRAVERDTSIKQLWGMHKLEEQCQAHS